MAATGLCPGYVAGLSQQIRAITERTTDSSAADGPAQGDDEDPGTSSRACAPSTRAAAAAAAAAPRRRQDYVETGSGGADATVPDFAWAHLPDDGRTGGGDAPASARAHQEAPRLRADRGARGAGRVISTLFGMMMAVASDLPALEEPAAQLVVMVDRRDARLGLLTGNQNRILVS